MKTIEAYEFQIEELSNPELRTKRSMKQPETPAPQIKGN